MSAMLGICSSGSATDSSILRTRETPTLWRSRDSLVSVSCEAWKQLDVTGSREGSGDGSILIWVDGECFNLVEATGLPSSLDVRGGSDFENAIARAYCNGNLSSLLERLDGSFVAVLYDESKRQLLLCTDRLGSKPLYWFDNNGIFAWSSSLLSLSSISESDDDLDREALSCFLDLGFLLEDKTWFQSMKLLDPASVLTYQCKPVKRRSAKYWDWNKVGTQRLSFDDTVAALYSAFMDSVEERFNPHCRVGLSLSGGLDSRALLAAVTRLDPKYQGYAFVFGLAGSADVQLAQKVCQLCSWELEHFDLSTQSNWVAERRKLVIATDGMLDLKHLHVGEFLNRVETRIDVCLNGFLGDVIAGGSWLPIVDFLGLFDQIEARAHLKSRVSLRSFSKRSEHVPPLEPMLLENRGRRFTNLGILGNEAFFGQRLPFVSNRMVEWALSTPRAHRRFGRAYKAMLLRHFPAFFESIPWQKTMQPISPGRGVFGEVFTVLRRKVHSLGRSAASKEYADYDQWVTDPTAVLELSKILQRPLDADGVASQSDKIVRGATALMFFSEAEQIHHQDVKLLQACLEAIHESLDQAD